MNNLAAHNQTRIADLEAVMRKSPQLDIETRERFIGAMYVREIVIPEGAAITSRVYKRAYVDIMLSGDITISDSNGTYRISGHHVLEGTPGRKRAGFAHKETHWVTVHDCHDIKGNGSPIESISFEHAAEYDDYRVNLAREGFKRFLLDCKLDAETVQQESKADPVANTPGAFLIADSQIHGRGVFASQRFITGEVIGLTLEDGQKTVLGRYTNHSDYPNTMIYENKLIATQPIDAGNELTIDYRYTPRGLLCQE